MQTRIFQATLALLSLALWVIAFPTNWINSWWGIIPLSLYFFSFVLGILGWGIFLKELFAKNAATVWLFSSFVAIVFAMLAGHSAMLGASHRWLFLLFFHLGFFSLQRSSLREAFLHFKNPWLSLPILFVFVLRFLSAYLPQAHGDPLLYHLMGPRLWNQAGTVHLNQDLPVPLLAATWEYFFLWPQVLFTSEPATTSQLAVAQVFSQWIHLLFGFYGSVVLFDALLARKGKIFSELERCLFILAMLFVGSMQWTAALAKNDCAVALWCLGSWFFLEDGFSKKKKFHFLWAGVFAGFAVSAKISAILFFIPLAMVFFLKQGRKNLSGLLAGLAIAGVGAILGVFPVYFRNWVETRDPFFTMFARWFPSPWISQSWADHFNTHQPVGRFQILQMMKDRTIQFSHENPAMWLWLLFPFLLCQASTRKKVLLFADWIFLFIFAMAVMIVAVMPDAEMRYLGAVLWVAAAMGIWFALVAMEEFIPAQQRVLEILLLLILLATSKLPTHFLWKFFRSSPGAAYVLKHSGGEAKEWLREHAGNRLVVLNGDNETYYLSTLRVTVLTERPDIDKATYGQKDGTLFLRGLCESSKAGLLLDTRATIFGLHLRFPELPWANAIDFESSGSRVYNLTRLQELVFHRDVGCGHS